MNCCYIFTYNNTHFDERNGFYVDLLYKSIETLLIFYHKDIKNLYIFIDNNINKYNYTELTETINNINNYKVNIIYKLIDLRITNIIKYPEKNANADRINRIGLLKFFIPYLVNCKNILYIDCDILFKDNILNEIYKEYNQEKTLLKMFQYGFNSGLILFNCELWCKEKNILNDIIDYYNTHDVQFVDNETFTWLACLSKYQNKCIKDNNFKINFPIIKPEWGDFDNIEYDWHNMNVLHVCGTFDTKIDLFYKIYDWIKNNNELL